MSKFKVGDRVRIIGRSVYKSVRVGDIGTVTDIRDGGVMVNTSKNPRLAQGSTDASGGHLYFRSGSVELVPNRGFKVGDRVRRIKGDGRATAHYIPLGSVLRVTSVNDYDDGLRFGEDGYNGFYLPKYFELVEESPTSAIELDLEAQALIADLNLLGQAEDSLTEHGQLAAAGQVRRAREDMLADLGRLIVEAKAQA